MMIPPGKEVKFSRLFNQECQKRIMVALDHGGVVYVIRLSYDVAELKRVIAFPLFIRGIDSSPCTVMAEIV